MANSQYEYVKNYERENYLIPETYIVVRVDGRGFHRFSKFYGFEKPNDQNALSVMNKAAVGVMKSVQDVVLAYGDSDEYSFVFDPSTSLFERREAKLVTTIVSTFTAHYMHNWVQLMPRPLDGNHLPTFDGRAVVYPTLKSLRDYLSWRQVDCHINNLYNTTFWNLVSSGKTPQEAEHQLRGTLSSDKNEILFSQLGINYNNEPEMFKKGTVLVWDNPIVIGNEKLSDRQLDKLRRKRNKAEVLVLHCNIIKDKFWAQHKIFSI